MDIGTKQLERIKTTFRKKMLELGDFFYSGTDTVEGILLNEYHSAVGLGWMSDDTSVLMRHIIQNEKIKEELFNELIEQEDIVIVQDMFDLEQWHIFKRGE